MIGGDDGHPDTLELKTARDVIGAVDMTVITIADIVFMQDVKKFTADERAEHGREVQEKSCILLTWRI